MSLAADQLLARLAADLVSALGPELTGLYVHGSWTVGDFQPGRSDLDLMAVLAFDPTVDTLATLTRVHDQLARNQPEWHDHVEVDYVTAEAVRDALAGKEPRPMVRISPGEPIHLTAATPHYLLNWHAARQHGQVLHGPPPTELLPELGADRLRLVLLEHVRQWPDWVEEMRTPGSQAYAVLAVCRAAATLATGRQLSKRAAATYAQSVWPEWSTLIGWASDWWYAGGDDNDPDRFAEVARFVRVVAPELLELDPHESQRLR